MHKPPRVFAPVERSTPPTPTTPATPATPTTPSERAMAMAASPPSTPTSSSSSFGTAASSSPSKRTSIANQGDEIRSGTTRAGRPRARTLERRMRVSYGLVPSDTEAADAHCFAINKIVALDADASGHELLFTASRDSSIRVWQVDARGAGGRGRAVAPTVTAVARLQDHADWVNDIALLADGTYLASCSSDTTVKLWKLSECLWYQDYHHRHHKRAPASSSSLDSACTSDTATDESTSTLQPSSGSAASTPDQTPLLRNNASTRTLKAHNDYVKALAVSSFGLASGGLDGKLFLWDVNASDLPVRSFSTSGALPSSLRSTLSWAPSSFSTPASIYSLTASPADNLLVAGCCDSVVRVFDPRTNGISACASLLGHSDNIRTVQTIGPYTVASGSADGTIRVWDLRQRQSLHTFTDCHGGSVWAIVAPRTPVHSPSVFIAGGRDCSIVAYDYESKRRYPLVQDKGQVVALEHSPSGLLWSSNPQPNVNCWQVPSDLSAEALESWPLSSEPSSVIPGRPAIVRHSILNNRRQVLTEDTSGRLALWDVLHGKRVRDFGANANWDETLKSLFEIVSVPNWFVVDTKTGSITVHLEHPQCFNALIPGVDMGLETSVPYQRMNAGERVLSCVFEGWLAEQPEKEKERSNASSSGKALVPLPMLSLPPHTPVMISDIRSGVPLLRTTLEQIDGSVDVPMWVANCLLRRDYKSREDEKMSFLLLPHNADLPALPSGSTRLTASKALPVALVVSYIYLNIGMEVQHDELQDEQQQQQPPAAQDQTATDNSNAPAEATTTKPKSTSAPPETYLELLCRNQLLPVAMSLATVKHFYWKSSELMQLTYRRTSATALLPATFKPKPPPATR